MTAIQANLGLLNRNDQAFEQACASWNARVRHNPESAVRPASAEGVAAAVRYAIDNTMRVRVQATGHGACEASEGGLLISTAALRDVTVDPQTRTALIPAGAKWKDVVPLAYEHGMAPLVGTSSDVGAVGFTLGGGTSWFVREYGMACESVQAAQIVTADGRLRWVDAQTEPDLFWALRGGGPNFGVVTAVRMALTPHAEVYAGGLIWPAQLFSDVATAWRDWVTDLPAGLSSSLSVLHAPDAPFVPEPMRGKSFVAVLGCYAGDPAEGERLTAPLRTVGGLLMDTFGPMPFTRSDEIAQDPVDPLPFSLWGTMLSTFDESVIDRLASIAPRGAAPYTIMEVRHVGGGPRPAADRRGLAHWSGDFMMETISVTPQPEALAAAVGFETQLDAELADVSTAMTPLNFVSSADRVGRAYTSEHLARLQEIKRRYDPANLFGGDRPLPGN